MRVPVKAGLRQVVATILKAEDAEPEGAGPDRIPIWSRDSDVATVPASISSLLVGGPYNAEVPQDSPSRRLIFVCHPAERRTRRPARPRFCRRWRGVRIGGRRPATTCKRCSRFYKTCPSRRKFR